MKRILAIPLLMIFLCSSTEIHQLLKLPVLLHHFLEHRRHDGSISFLTFLKEHYIKEHAEAAQHHHERLPFKSNHCASAHLSPADPLPPLYTRFKEPLQPVKQVFLYQEPYHSNSFISRIWQPPRA